VCCLCLQDDGGGGGGGDGWNWERTARNVLPNLVFLGMYFMITSYGGDGWGGGFFGECCMQLSLCALCSCLVQLPCVALEHLPAGVYSGHNGCRHIDCDYKCRGIGSKQE
jgi:hypothetical protein